MTNVSDFYNQPRRVRFIYEGDKLIPKGTAGVTEGFPYSERNYFVDAGGGGPVANIDVIDVKFDGHSKWLTVALTDLEWE